MIPLEMLTMLGSGLIGGVMSIWAQSLKAKRDQHNMLMDRAIQQSKNTKSARRMQNKEAKFTRRIIALTAVFSIILLPMLAPMFFDTTVTVGYTEWEPGFWFFTEGQDTMRWRQITTNSIVITPLHTHLVSAITGFYFGNKVGT